MSTINYSEKIPNNVNLGEDRTLQRALEAGSPTSSTGGTTSARTTPRTTRFTSVRP